MCYKIVESLGQFIVYLLNDYKIERSTLTLTLMTIKNITKKCISVNVDA